MRQMLLQEHETISHVFSRPFFFFRGYPESSPLSYVPDLIRTRFIDHKQDGVRPCERFPD
jgi:hypothetical protein